MKRESNLAQLLHRRLKFLKKCLECTMESNPYSPPKSSVAKSSVAKSPKAIGSRPIPVWLLLVLLAGLTVLSGVGVVRHIWFAMPHLPQVSSKTELAIILVAMALRACVFATLVAAVLAIFSRRRWGRWLGLMAILALTVIVLSTPDRTVYANDAEKAGGVIGRFVLIPVVLVWWGYAFAFSTKSKHYFGLAAIES